MKIIRRKNGKIKRLMFVNKSGTENQRNLSIEYETFIKNNSAGSLFLSSAFSNKPRRIVFEL